MTEGGIDWTGLTLLTAGLASLQFVLEQGERDDWFQSQTIVLLSVISAVSLVLFVLKTLRDKHPLVDLGVFKFRSFSVGSFLGIIMGFGLFGTSLVLPLFFQNMLGFTAFDTGMALMPGAISTAVSMLIIGRILNRIDGRWSIVFGTLLFAWSTWLLGGLNVQAGYWDVFWPRVVQGFALGFLFVPLTTISLSDVPVPKLAGATGVFTLLRQLGGSLRDTVILTDAGDASNRRRLERARIGCDAEPRVFGGAAHDDGRAAGDDDRRYNYIFRVTAVLFVLTAPLVFLIRRHPPASEVALEASEQSAA